MFKYLTCPLGNSVTRFCINSQCTSKPFLCDAECDCRSLHMEDCRIKGAEELDDDLKRVLLYEYLVVYSATLKGEGIEVCGRFAKQTVCAPSNSRFALTYEPIVKESEVEISFKVCCAKGCIGVGVLIKETIERNQYRYSLNKHNLGHGGFMLLSNGLLYSHSDPNDNLKESKVKLVQGSTVKVKYSFGSLSFGQADKLQVSCGQAESLYFGVYLFDKDDQVEILRRK